MTSATPTPRRQHASLLAVVVLALAAALLTACGDDGGETSSASSSASGSTSAAAATTKSFVDVYGEEIEVPSHAQRIVAIHDSNGGEQVLSLGYEVVGFPTRGGTFAPEIAEVYDLEGVAEVGDVYTPNIEVIADLEPDLIIGEGYDGKGMDQFFDAENVQEQLEAIAPVVYIDTFRPVDEVMADFAELLGPDAEEEFETQRAEYEEGLDEVADELGDPAGLTVSIVSMRAGDLLNVHGETTLVPSVIVSTLGIDQPAYTAEAEAAGGFLELSLERIPEVDGDLIVLDKGVGEFGAHYSNNPLWQNLAAVEAGQVLESDESWYGTTYQRYQLVLDALAPELIAADRDVFS